MDKINSIEEMGFNPFFESAKKDLLSKGFSIARIIAEFKEVYRAKNTEGEFLARISGKKVFDSLDREDYPAVGDWVAITMLDDDHALIHHVLPRQTVIKRKFGEKNRIGEKNKVQIIAANLDVAFIIESLDKDYSLNRFERYLAILNEGGIKPVIVLNKIDLISKNELEEKLAMLRNRFPNIDLILTSTLSEAGLDDLMEYIRKGKTYCFLGSSGVGKSSLINKLLGDEVARTGKVCAVSGRGKHVTTNRQMYFLENGGIVIDNPGIREVSIVSTSKGIDDVFDEISDYAKECKYGDCTHTHEKGCRVLDAVKSGKLEQEKYSNYINLKKEVEYNEMNSFGRKEKDRRFGKFIKKAKKDLKSLGQKY